MNTTTQYTELKVGTDAKTFSENVLRSFLAGKPVAEALTLAHSMQAISAQSGAK